MNPPPVEPVKLEEYPTQEIPDRLQKIINILQSYHRELCQDLTLSSQDPDHAKTIVRPALARIGKRLELCLKDKNACPEVNTDTKFREVYENLDKIRNPWDPKISTMMFEYIQMLFFDCPLTHTVEHCNRQRIYAKEYQDVVDGTE